MENPQGTELKPLVLNLKSAVDALAKAFEPAPAAAAAAPVVETPAAPAADLNKAVETEVMKSVDAKLDSFLGELRTALGVLEAPKAAQNATGKVITKAADGASAAAAEEDLNDEPVFKAQGAQGAIAMTPELRAAFKGLRGVPLGE